MRIAATADLHFVPSSPAILHDQLSKVRDEADVLVLAGDLTNYGLPAEIDAHSGFEILVPHSVNRSHRT